VSQMRAASGRTTTLVAAGTFYRGTGICMTATTAATVVAPWWIARDDWDGGSVVGPGNAIHLMASTAVLVAATVTLVYAEIPL